MAHNPYIARVPGEEFDADQIEGGDHLPNDYALLRKIEDSARAETDADRAYWKAKIAAEKAARLAVKPVCEACGITLPDYDECYGCSTQLVFVERISPTAIAA